MASSSEVCTHLPSPVSLALQQRDEDALRQEDARAEVGDRDAHAHRTLAGQPRDRHQAAHTLGDLIHARPVAIRPALAEAGDAAVDEPRVDRAQLVVVDPEPTLDVGAVVLDDHVGVLRELLEDRHALGLAQVQRDAALVAVQVLEVEPVAIAAHAVAGAPAGHLDLDGLGAPVDELAHARRAGARAGEIEDVVAAEGERRGRSRPRLRRPALVPASVASS